MSKYYRSVLNVLIPAFASTRSFQFDGVDDQVAISSSFVATGEFTISLWMKPTIFNSNQNILGFGSSGSNWINPSSATNIRVRTSSTLLNFPETGGNNLVLNAWNHILIYRDSSNNIGVFVNGATFGATSNNTGSLSLSTIGRGANKRFAGNLDEIAFWTSNQSSNVSSIFGTGVPNDISSLNPVAWYRMGENSNYKSPQWLMPENSNFANSRFSNFSLKFDGMDDFIDCGDADNFSFGNGSSDSAFSISCWVYFDVVSGSRSIISKFGSSGDEWLFYIQSTPKLRFLIKDNSVNKSCRVEGSTTLLTGQWYHVVSTYNGVGGSSAGNGIKIYLNSVEETLTVTNNASYVAMENTAQPVEIGRNDTNYFNGKIDEVSLYRTVLSPTDIDTIYGTGFPNDISSLSPFTHYRMGEEATFVYNIYPEGTWTIPDQVGSNDGTSNNTFLDTGRVGDAPNSTSNAVSFNMLETDRKTDVPI